MSNAGPQQAHVTVAPWPAGVQRLAEAGGFPAPPSIVKHCVRPIYKEMRLTPWRNGLVPTWESLSLTTVIIEHASNDLQQRFLIRVCAKFPCCETSA